MLRFAGAKAPIESMGQIKVTNPGGRLTSSANSNPRALANIEILIEDLRTHLLERFGTARYEALLY
jgi:hypothetical protein